mgnify:FL=1
MLEGHRLNPEKTHFFRCFICTSLNSSESPIADAKLNFRSYLMSSFNDQHEMSIHAPVMQILSLGSAIDWMDYQTPSLDLQTKVPSIKTFEINLYLTNISMHHVVTAIICNDLASYSNGVGTI